MRLRSLAGFALLIVSCVLPLGAQSSKVSSDDKMTVVGKLTRVMAIGAETSGWAVELDPPLSVNGKQVASIEVVEVDSKKLDALENRIVKATGTLSNAAGVETGERPVLAVSSIKAVKQKPPAPAAH